MKQTRAFFGRAAHWSESPLARLLGPMQEFIHQAQSGGIILIVMTILALILANTGFAGLYTRILDSHIGIMVGPFVLEESVLHWINDGLMAIFFFLVGLEIKREVMVGELASLRAALLPIIAAVGGAVVPALIYALLNAGGVGSAGWGIPMATDIAFALGCLALLGDRIPFGLKVFLTAVAIVDDLIAVLVIAIFYSGQLNTGALAVGLGLLLLLTLANRFGIRTPILYAGVGLIVWLAFLQSGVHATIAGVLVALTIPAHNRIDAPTFLRRSHRLLHEFDPASHNSSTMLTDERQQTAVRELEDLCEQVQAPLQRLEHALHGWVMWLIMPIFALANAGVALALSSLTGAALPVLLGIVLGLTLGKPLGLLGAAWLATRAGLTDLPMGVSWRHMVGVGILAGIGFTMSLFIASLGLQDPDVQATAKIAILLASIVAGSLGLLVLRGAKAPAG